MMKIVVLSSLVLMLVGCGSESQVLPPIDSVTVSKSSKTNYEHNSSLSGITKHLASDKVKKELKKAQKHWYKMKKPKKNKQTEGFENRV